MEILFFCALAIVIYYGSIPYRNHLRAYPHHPVKISSIVIISQTANELWCQQLAEHIKDDLISNFQLALNYETYILAGDDTHPKLDKIVPTLNNWRLQNLPKISPRTFRIVATHHLDDGGGYFTFDIVDHRGTIASNQQSVVSCVTAGGSYIAIQELVNKIHHHAQPS